MNILCTVGFCLAFVSAAAEETLIVETELGKVEGVVDELKSGFKLNSFLGVQYGTVPQRFSKPTPIKPWTETKVAKKWPPRCMQTHVFGPAFQMNTDSEDCLYLNLFAPHKKTEGGYPVMIFIHGGGYLQGSSLEYGLDGIKNLIVPKGVVFIIFHYRMGPWGFFSTGSKDAPGNYGMWDQTLLLQWVQDHVASFGGNPNRVTLFGESAGAMSTGFQSVSPHSRDLFHNAILMSGSLLSSFTDSDATVQTSLTLAKSVGCNQKEAAEIVKCMKSVSNSDLENALEKMTASGLVVFSPRIDNDFLPGQLEDLLAQSPSRPIIIGTTKDEMGLFVTPPSDDIKTVWTIKDPKKFTFDQYRKNVQMYFVSQGYKNLDLLTDVAIYHYVDSVGDRNNGTFLTQAYIDFVGDYLIYSPANKESKMRLNSGAKVWLYSFDYFNPEFAPGGSYHFFDLWYFFKFVVFRSPKFSNEEEKIADYYTTLFTNFAKYDNPVETMAEVKWLPITKQNPENYLKINNKLEIGNLWHRRGSAFWNYLLPKIQSINFSSYKQSTEKEEL